jgi:hypothetical protein
VTAVDSPLIDRSDTFGCNIDHLLMSAHQFLLFFHVVLQLNKKGQRIDTMEIIFVIER